MGIGQFHDGITITVPKMVGVRSRFRLEEACRITRDLVARNPVTPDRFAEYEALQMWPLVLALYSGIEQALKMLLLTPSDTCFTLKGLKDKYGHNLVRLYTALEAADREHIELHFREHWSLYDYELPKGVTIGTAEEFLVHINGGSPSTGLPWRYFLLDESAKIPSTSLWTMSEIWDAVCCCIRKASDQGGCLRLSQRLVFQFDRVGWVVPYDGYLDEIGSWVARSGDPVAAWVDLLVQANRNAVHKVQAPDQLRRELAAMASEVIERLSGSSDADNTQLLHRIQHTEQTLVWDSGNAEFRWDSSI